MTRPGFEAGSLVNVVKPKSAPTRAWRNLMHTVTVTAPRSLTATTKSIARLRRL